MQREIQLTSDGSHTMAIPEMQVQYHSKHGSIKESNHVYINAGLKYLWEETPFKQENAPAINILEIGFGTGLNALLSLIEAEHYKKKLFYTGIELYPLNPEEYHLLNFGHMLNQPIPFLKLHQIPWGIKTPVTQYFTIKKMAESVFHFSPENQFHCVYYDAFAPAAQPELWTQEIFQSIIQWMEPSGILLTYCSKSVVRKAMQYAGFSVNKLKGPLGKREMVRAVKN